jgi:hypothetical protein
MIFRVAERMNQNCEKTLFLDSPEIPLREGKKEKERESEA